MDALFEPFPSVSVNAAVRNGVPAGASGASTRQMNVQGGHGVVAEKDNNQARWMDEEKIKTLVLVAGQHLRREYPLEPSGLTWAMADNLERMRKAEEALALRERAEGRDSKRT